MAAPNVLEPKAPRVWGFAAPNGITCARGHRIPEDAFFFDHGALRCKHREPLQLSRDDKRAGKTAGHGPECGSLLYVLAGLHAGLVDRGGMPAMLFVAEVTYQEIREMQSLRLDVLGVLDFLGVGFPRPRPSRG